MALRLLALGDDHQLAGDADELLVHLAEGDVVRMIGVQQRGARLGVAGLQLVREVQPEGHRARRTRATTAQRLLPVPSVDQAARDGVVERVGRAVRRCARLRRPHERQNDRVQRHDAEEDRDDPEGGDEGQLLHQRDAWRRRSSGSRAPSATIDTIAGLYRLMYERTIAVCLSCSGSTPRGSAPSTAPSG